MDVASALYRKQPKGDGGFGNVKMAGKLAKLAQQAGAVENVVEVWEENWQSVSFFLRVGRTRWAHGFSGPIGLRYEAIYPLMDRMNLSTDEWDALHEDLEIMEQAALECIHAKA